MQEIKEWTKESLREKPFSTAKGKIWTETPSSILLQKIFTKLCWVKLNRLTYEVGMEEMSDVTHLLSEQHHGENRPKRILIEGEVSKSIQFTNTIVNQEAKCITIKLENTHATIHFSGGFRISQRGHQLQRGGEPTYYFKILLCRSATVFVVIVFSGPISVFLLLV